MSKKEYPFYIKSTVVLFGLILFVYILITLREILVPVAFSAIIAILLNPAVNKLKSKGVGNVAAISIVLFISIIFISSLLYFLSSQIAGLVDNLPLLKMKFGNLLHELQEWLHARFGITIKKQVQLVNDALAGGNTLIGSTLGTALGTLSVVLLLPVYTFLLLFYKSLILNFLFEVFSEENSTNVRDVLDQTKNAIQSYMVGLLMEALIVAIMNSTALLFLGVKYAILIGVIGALLNMVPYIGGIIAIALPILMATVTKDGYSTQIGIVIVYLIIQFIDNNIIVPRIVSSKVQINALFSIIIVLLGGAMWGVSGMFLSIPFVAIIKITFDSIDELKPWGKLLGDKVPTRHKGQLLLRRRRPKKETVSEKIVEGSS